MQTKLTFRRLAVLSAFILLAAVLILAVNLYHQGPHVRHIVYDDNHGGAHPTVTFDLSQPLSQSQVIQRNITISPRVPFTAVVSGQQIIVTMQQPLNDDTTYIVTLKPGIVSTRSVPTKESFTYHIHTPAATYSYLRRDYCNDAPKCQDEIIQRQVTGNQSAVIARFNYIETFDQNYRYVAVLHTPHEAASAFFKPTQKSILSVVDTQKHTTTDISLPYNETITQIRIAHNAPVVAFISNVKDTMKSKLYTYRIGTKQLIYHHVPGEDDDTADVYISNDGHSILFEDFSQTFYITDALIANYHPIYLGTYATTGGFSHDDSKLLFMDSKGNVLLYDATAKTTHTVIPAGSTSNYLFSGDKTLLYDSSDYGSNDELADSVVLGNKQIYTETHDLLLSFSTNTSNRYLLMELQPQDPHLDNYSDVFSKSRSSNVLVYDIKAQKVLNKLTGVDPIWHY